jgi:alpha-2-macroglobulin
MPPYDYLANEQQPMTTLRLPISAYGTANGTFRLPPGSLPGFYTIKSPDFAMAGGISFQVAEYKKPEFELTAAFEKTDVLPGEALHASVSAAYYFGAPAGNMQVSWMLTAQSTALYIPGGWETGPYDAQWLNTYPALGQFGTYLTQGQGITAPDGSLKIDIPAEALAQVDPRQRQTLTLEVTAVDESSFPVSTRAETLFHPAAFYAGLRPEAWGIQAGSELGFSLQTVNWQTQPSGNHSLSARFSKVRWVRKDPPGGMGEPTYQKELTPVASTDLRTDGLGRARVTFTPPDPGVYELTVSGEGAFTSLLTWVGGPGSAPWPNLPSQRLRLESDAASYAPGQTARLRFANPYPGEALALVTIERSRVLTTQVIQVSGSMAEVEIPIDALYAPNVFAAVTLLGRKENGQSDFRQGFLEIKVDPAALQLNVAVQPSAERAQPGQDLGLTLKVTDSAGAPVQGEFSLALVDKAVLALADPNVPDIFTAFYGPQPLGVATGLNLASYSGRLLPMRAGRGGGGGGDMGSGQTRTNFKDTAAWIGAVETDANGLTRINVKLPDNLTTWVADIRGVTTDTRVGAARVEIVTSKDLLVRPVAPRFLTAGDHLVLGAIVQNNTAGALSTSVELQAPGLTLDPATPAAQNVDVNAGDRRRVDWWVTVENVATVDPLFSVAGGGLSDSTRLENGPLPVLRYTSPQTFATGGLLAQGGERLEVVSLPRTFTAVGGELKVELAPSLAASVLNGLQALETNFPTDSTEQILSRLLPNLAAYRALTQINLNTPNLGPTLTNAITQQLHRLVELQREDGGFGWAAGASSSQPYLSSYALIALTEAKNQGFFNNQPVFDRLNTYLFANYFTPDQQTEAWRLDQLAFMAFASAGYAQAPDPSIDAAIAALYDRQELLSPWARALLAQAINLIQPGDERIQALVSNLETAAVRSATGASWDAPGPGWYSWSTPGFSTAIVVYTLAKLDPAAAVLTDAVRYLVLSRRSNGCWQSSYESAWVLFALSEALTATGDLQADFTYEAELNGTRIASGSPADAASALQPVQASVPLTDLFSDGANALRIRRSAGSGRLYYRAFLEVNRPAEDAPPLERGISLSRAYYRSDQQCRLEDCVPVTQAALTDNAELLVRLTVTIPQDMYFVIVKDTIPSGVEIIDPNLNTSRRVFAPTAGPDTPAYDLRDPFGAGYCAWLFGQAQIRDQGVTWTAPYLPAGTYQLTYRVVPVTAGEFRVLPAQAYQYYFSDVQGTSSGSIFTIN